MLICHRNADFSGPSCDDDYDWSASSASYLNLEDFPTIITRQRESAQQRPFTTTADPSCPQGKQLATYNLVKDHTHGNNTTPLRMIVSGTSGTGKSYLIHCLRLVLQHKVCVVAPTGVAAINVDGHTLHSLLCSKSSKTFKKSILTRSNRHWQVWSISSLTRCLWLAGRCLVRLTVRCSLIDQIKC